MKIKFLKDGRAIVGETILAKWELDQPVNKTLEKNLTTPNSTKTTREFLTDLKNSLDNSQMKLSQI